MATGSENYLSLVKQAFHGDLKLPAFQRSFKWNRKQVIRLYDSIRLSYPLGSIILLEGSKQELKERSFRGSTAPAAEAKETKRLVLDGQQRLTAGIDLFYGETEESLSQYFIDINKIVELVQARKVDVGDEASVLSFLKDLDDDDGYCIARARSPNPFYLLTSRHLISTILLRPDNSKNRDHFLEEYEQKYPEYKKVIRNIIKPYFVINEAPDIPYVAIDSSLQLDSISRIFSTLNSTGQVLTPFELVVAVLFSSGVDLREDLEILREVFPHLKNMDASGEICLQTVVMMVGENHKKSLLPKKLKPNDWNNHRDKAGSLLDQVGTFLTQNFGMALDITDDLVPYDSIFAPMALVFDKVGYDSLSPSAKGSANSKLIQWVVGSALSQRYQEGVHGKQSRDAEDMITWIAEGSDEYKPGWLTAVAVPSLRLVTTKGAIANLLRCLVNQDNLKDPLSGTNVNFGKPGVHAHHIFPKKFVTKIAGWDEKIGDNADIFLNLMQLDSSTNASFLNDDPSLQLVAAGKTHSPPALQEIYERQGIPADALAILQKSKKTREDYLNFVKIRETFFEKKLASLGFSKTTDQEFFDELDAA